MPLGILQPRDGEAPGTALLIDSDTSSDAYHAAFNFKHAAGKVHTFGEDLSCKQKLIDL